MKTRAEDAVGRAAAGKTGLYARKTSRTNTRAVVIRGNEAIATRRESLWAHVSVIGDETLHFARKGLGKTQISEDFAARVTTGAARPGEPEGTKHEPGSVIIMSTEDDPHNVIVPRLIGMNANMANIFIVPSLKEGDQERGWDLGADLHVLEAEVAKLKDAGQKDFDPLKLLIISPISGYSGIRDSNDTGQIRSMLNPISNMLKKHRVAGWYIGHPRKDGGGSVLDQHLGSSAVTNAVRTVFFSVFDPDGEEDDGPKKRLFLREATNLERDDQPFGFGYKIVGSKAITKVRELDGTIHQGEISDISKIEWLGRDDRKPDDVMARWREMGLAPKDDKKSDAMVLIMAELVQGPQSGAHMTRIREDAHMGDVTWRNARKQLQRAGAVAMDGAGRDVVWRLGDGTPWDDRLLPDEPNATPSSGSNAVRPDVPFPDEVPAG